MANSGRFDAVINGVADHVEQRVFEMLEDAGIDLDVSAHDVQARKFAVALRDVADGAGELLEQRSHRNQANTHDLFLQVFLQALDFAMHFEELASGNGLKIFDHAPQTALGNGNLAGQVQHVIEFVGIDSERAIPGS